MKKTTIFFLLLAHYSFGGESERLWLELSTTSQNLAYSLQQIPPGGMPSLSMNEERIKKVDRIISELVYVGELDKLEVSLKKSEIEALWGDEEFIELKGTLFEKHGAYVASDLLDIGSRIRFVVIKNGQPIELNIRIPHKEMQSLKEILGTVTQNQSEQDNPITRP